MAFTYIQFLYRWVDFMCVYGVYVYVERYVCIGMQVVSTYVKKKKRKRKEKEEF